MIYEFFVDYAPDKDRMGEIGGSVHVAVEAANAVDAALAAEQMVAATGVEPVACRRAACPDHADGSDWFLDAEGTMRYGCVMPGCAWRLVAA